jgi:hypothetical protein
MIIGGSLVGFVAQPDKRVLDRANMKNKKDECLAIGRLLTGVSEDI